MGTITTKDGTEIYYKGWGKGHLIVFSHGWPLSADDWDTQMLSFLKHGYRVIAHDRRGHGRSTQVSDGHDMDHYADDLAALTAHLDLKNAIHVGHSTGGGEVARYLGRHGESRVAKAALISAVPPLMVKTAANPGGLPNEVFDGLQAQPCDGSENTSTGTFRLLYALIVLGHDRRRLVHFEVTQIRHKSGYRGKSPRPFPGTPRPAICCGTGTHPMVRRFVIAFG